jgi:hypothetical protein
VEPNELSSRAKFSIEDELRPVDFLESLISGQNQKSKACPHTEVKSDYLGTTCLSCGKVMAGKGFDGTHKTCIHKYEYEYETMLCTYCGKEKKD